MKKMFLPRLDAHAIAGFCAFAGVEFPWGRSFAKAAAFAKKEVYDRNGIMSVTTDDEGGVTILFDSPLAAARLNAELQAAGVYVSLRDVIPHGDENVNED